MKKNIFALLVCAATTAMVFGCGNGAKKAEDEAAAAAEQARRDSIAAAEQAAKEKTAMDIISILPEEPVFDIVTNLGTIKVKLYSKTPKHRENFAKLALTGYYDSLLFHRVINGFMIQGGDPFTRDTSAAAVAKYGQGGPGYTIPAEFVPLVGRHLSDSVDDVKSTDRLPENRVGSIQLRACPGILHDIELRAG